LHFMSILSKIKVGNIMVITQRKFCK
jgi:hypothetical protein